MRLPVPSSPFPVPRGQPPRWEQVFSVSDSGPSIFTFSNSESTGRLLVQGHLGNNWGNEDLNPCSLAMVEPPEGW